MEELELALVEEDLGTVVVRRAEVSAAVHAAGYRYVTLDLDGLRSGNLNQALDGADRSTADLVGVTTGGAR